MNRDIGFIELLETAGKSIKETLSAKRRGELYMTRSTLAITMAMKLLFQTEKGLIGPEETQIISNVLPLLIANNDYCDIGIPADKRLRHTDQYRFYPLVELKNKLLQRRNTELERISKKYSERNEDLVRVLRVYIEDSELLARNAAGLSSNEYPNFLGIDSALFEVVFVGAVNLAVLKRIVPDFFVKCTSYEELKHKYQFFLDEKVPVDSFERRILGLHMTEMVLKVSDDLIGVGEDEMLGVPSFLKLAKSSGGEDWKKELSKRKRHYRDRAVACGIPRILVNLADLTLLYSRRIKLNLAAKKTEPREIFQIKDAFIAELKVSSRMRETLNGMAFLPELFGQG